MLIGIIGSRSLGEREDIKREVWKVVQYFLMFPETTIVSGGATGPDRWGADACKQLGKEPVVHLPDWSLGKGAGFIRNTKIAEDSDILFAYWDGTSRGTMDTVRKARLLGKPVFVREFPIEY